MVHNTDTWNYRNVKGMKLYAADVSLINGWYLWDLVKAGKGIDLIGHWGISSREKTFKGAMIAINEHLFENFISQNDVEFMGLAKR